MLKIDFNRLKNKIPDIDLETGIKNVGGSKNLYVKLLKDFVTRYGDVHEKLENLHSTDIETTGQIVHTLKGLTGSLGAYDLHAIFIDLDRAIKENRPVGHLMDDMKIVFGEVITQITNTFPKEEALRPEPKAVNIKNILNQLNDLKKLISINDMASEGLLESFFHNIYSLIPAKSEKLSDAILAIDFKTAAETIDVIISEIESMSKEEKFNG
ncbi:MAG: Hpt domain-containing protein [Desulfobacterales bacterium]|nr:Hpt domain-containing protein [Desulfobacterales bacterium]MCP4159909.1 Hpt domain-containing protein [Deltaproteobacteria bacterium]